MQSDLRCHQYRPDCTGGQKGKRERQDGLTKEYLFGVLKGGRGSNRLRGERGEGAPGRGQSCCGVQSLVSRAVLLDVLSWEYPEEELDT